MNGPGLPTLNESRKQRRRRITSGKAAIGGIPPRLFLGGLVLLIVGGFFYFRSSQAELEEQRRRIMAKQRAVATELGPRLLPMRDQIEQGLQELAEPEEIDEFVASGVDWEKLFSQSGIYLRLRRSVATDLSKARSAAMDSLRDGFTACLIRDPRAKPRHKGEPCETSQDCKPGELCNEYDVCGRPSSPFNARLLYRALSVLSEKWTQEVREAGTELALVAYERGLDSVTEVDIPVAIDVYQRAKYFVIVVDEEPKGGLPPHVDQDRLETEMQRLQRTPHQARVGVWSLPEGKPLARIEAEAAGKLRDVGRKVDLGPEALAARTRQANSCALALSMRQQLLARGRKPADGSTAAEGTTP